MTKSHEQMEKSIGCGVVPPSFFHADVRNKCTRDSGNLCCQCQIKRDVLDELTAALADTALLDTMERARWMWIWRNSVPLRICRGAARRAFRMEGVEVKCST